MAAKRLLKVRKHSVLKEEEKKSCVNIQRPFLKG